MKDFIISTPYNIKDLEPICVVKNEYGVDNNFYLITKAKFEAYRKWVRRHFINTDRLLATDEYKEELEGHIEWKINRDCIAIIDKPFRLEKFLQKDGFQKLNSWTNINPLK